MLTRIRFEAEGPTPEDCRNVLYAAAERLLRPVLASIYHLTEHAEDWSSEPFDTLISSWVHEEIYEALAWDQRVPEQGSLYKGRLVIGLSIAPPEQTITAERLRDRVEVGSVRIPLYADVPSP